jgi:hypothetical protein
MQLTPPPASDFTNKIGPWPQPSETVLMVSNLSGSGATPDPLWCSCILGHHRLSPTIITVAFVITSTMISAIRVTAAFSLPGCPLVAFFQAPVRPVASEWDVTNLLCFLPGVSGCVFFKRPINAVMPRWNIAAVIRRFKVPDTPHSWRNTYPIAGVFN